MEPPDEQQPGSSRRHEGPPSPLAEAPDTGRHGEDSSPSTPSPSSSPSSDEGLNVYSPRFDPQKALKHSRQMLPKLPCPNTRRLNNLHQYTQVINAGAVEDFEQNMVNALKPRPVSKKSNKYVDPTKSPKKERKFLPHQMPISTAGLSATLSNLTMKMNTVQGPLAKLREYRDKRVRVCVRTRCVYGGMNEMVGYVTSFDKHWNLALRDVEETFLRKRKRKVPPQLGPEVRLSEDELRSRGMAVPVVLARVGNKMERCCRHFPQLLVRGEQVVLVTPAL